MVAQASVHTDAVITPLCVIRRGMQINSAFPAQKSTVDYIGVTNAYSKWPPIEPNFDPTAHNNNVNLLKYGYQLVLTPIDCSTSCCTLSYTYA